MNITKKLSKKTKLYNSESTHFPGRNDPGRIDRGRTGNRGETTRYLGKSLGSHE